MTPRPPFRPFSSLECSPRPQRTHRHDPLRMIHLRTGVLPALLLALVLGSLPVALGAARPAAAAQTPTNEAAHPLSQPAALEALAEDLHGWTLGWDPADGGTFSARGRLPALSPPAQFAQGFVARHGALLGLEAAELDAVDARRAGHIEYRSYRQTHAGLPVEGSRLNFAFAADGSPLYVKTRTAPGIELARTRPTITLERARELGLQGLEPPAETHWHQGELVVVARRFSGLDADRLAWRLRCHTENPHGAWRMLVDAHTGELLERESLLMNAGRLLPADPGIAAAAETISGSVAGWIHDQTPFGPEILVDYPNLAIFAFEGETMLGSAVTDEQGGFLFEELTVENPDSLVVQAVLAGPYAVVFEDFAGGPIPEILLSSPQSPVEVVWDSLDAQAPSRAVFFHTQTAHARLKRFDESFTLLDRPVTIVSNDATQGTCNAFASLVPEAPRMTFLAAGGPCPNTAEIADVVYHEYGHLATMYAYLPEWAPSNLHEGFSDYFANTITDTSAIGMGFYPGLFVIPEDREASGC